MPTNISARDARAAQGAATAASTHGILRPSRAAKRRRRWITLYVGAALLGDRQFRENLFVGAITLKALAHLAREKQAHDRARLAAWWDALPAGPKNNRLVVFQRLSHPA
jgi:hypothetical protein